jgi:hypothetical protein
MAEISISGMFKRLIFSKALRLTLELNGYGSTFLKIQASVDMDMTESYPATPPDRNRNGTKYAWTTINNLFLIFN